MQTFQHVKLLGAFAAATGVLLGLAWWTQPGKKASSLLRHSGVTPESALHAPLPTLGTAHLAQPPRLASGLERPRPVAAVPVAIPPAPVVQKPAEPMGPAVPAELQLLLQELASAPKPLVINPLSAPEYRPFHTPVHEVLRCSCPDTDGIPPLYYAAMMGDMALAKDALAAGMDVNATTAGGDTALCAAVWHGQQDMVQLLLLAGADPNLPGRERQAPLLLASLRRSTDILEGLLLAGADANARFTSPLPKAILDAVQIRDLKSSMSYDRGHTALIACAARGDVEGASLLLRYGAKTGLPTQKHYRYPINFAATQGYLFLMRVLLGRPADEEPNLLVTVDLSKQKAWITQDGVVVDTTSISSGREGYSTPQGRYVVTDKHRTWTSTLYHVSMPYFMRLNCSAIGLHQGHVTGRPASHGCIRLPADKARAFFARVQVGDEVEIIR